MFDFLHLCKQYAASWELFLPDLGDWFGVEDVVKWPDPKPVFAEDVVYDSRRVRPGSVYVAIRGQLFDGHDYISEAAAKGAVAFVVEDLAFAKKMNLPCLCVRDTRAALAYFSYQVYFAPSDVAKKPYRKEENGILRCIAEENKRPLLISCCGSQGRETGARYLNAMLRQLGMETAVAYEMQFALGGRIYWTGRTKNQAPEWMSLLAAAREREKDIFLAPVSPLDIALKRLTEYPDYWCILDQASDVSAAALHYYMGAQALIVQVQYWRKELGDFFAQLRTAGKPVVLLMTAAAAAAFCFEGQDLHTYWNSLSTKQKVGSALLFLDELRIETAVDDTSFTCTKEHFGTTNSSSGLSLQARIRWQLWEGEEKEGKICEESLAVYGNFAVENYLRSYALYLLLSKRKPEVIHCLPNQEEWFAMMNEKPIQIPGRSELVITAKGKRILIDSAWRPGHLLQLGESLKPWLTKEGGRLLLIFGSGGNRSYFDRLEQGKACAQIAEEVALTVTSPRSEETAEIMRQLLEGCQQIKKEEFPCFADRLSALHYMLQKAGPHDLIVLAGRGEENYSIHASRLDWRTDRELIEQAERELSAAAAQK